MTQLERSIRRRLALCACLCLSLGACNATAGDTAGPSLEQSVAPLDAKMQALAPDARTSQASKAPSSAIASLPEDAGALRAVRAHTFADGFRQDIMLQGSAVHGVENGITVLARTSPQATLDEATPLFKPTEAAIRAELGRQFPNIGMQVAGRSSTNGYGPYGLALGRASGTVHCAYMWQWIDGGRQTDDAGLSGPLSVRVRLCRADTTFDALAALLDRFALQHDGLGAPVAEAVVAPPSEAQATVKPTRKRVVAHRRRRDRQPDAVAAAPAQPSLAAPAVAAASPPMQRFGGDLPPQAFLGPKAAPSAAKAN